ncbi:hypothetical protein F444_19525 [Phytophthora nicotianae P1976]|uniref:Integrase zinc-binding domain-containing protein n=1 Tax=Phytophthora nicotianae P1976 TaxID=1317066 RepID=A0A080Z7G0_PHYNI|nr:hypothetical protein F444_19525 [Phytophthora nicotianae P1976]
MVTTSRTATEHYYDEELGCWPIIVEHDATYCIDVPICSDSVQNMMGARLLTFQKRVVIPMALRQELVEWYHTQLVHPGPKRQFNMMKSFFYWSGMTRSIVEFTKNGSL